MDLTAFFKLNYGLYVISSMDGTRACGCVVNTLTQVTAEPARVTVAVNKGQHHGRGHSGVGLFAAAVLTDVPMDTISLFGFRSSREVDKFAQVSYGVDENGAPYLNEGVNARFACKGAGVLGRGHAPAVLAEVTDCEVLSSAPA